MNPIPVATEAQECGPTACISAHPLPPESTRQETTATRTEAPADGLYSAEEEALVVEHLKNLGYL
ncbi:MAG TPA: hypothetical protein VKX16_10205 [Chloroflexota bacterium]|nr:hypothetical protein [Chloroflexota bacterium]